MSLLFADIYEAIQNLRIQKGVCEKDILNYIEERVGGCLKAANFMKTVRTLQKLVDEGVLMKKGKRFAFSAEPPKQSSEDDEDEGCDENEGEAELDMSDDECDEGDDQNECEGNDGEDNDEDDDDDDDDDDEEDDDDDDDDDEDEEENACDEKDINLEKNRSSKNDQNPTDDNPLKSMTKERVILSPKKTTEDTSQKSTSAFGNGTNCDKSKENNETNSGRILNEETRNVIKQNDDIRRTETIAFCVRDFIDSLYRPKTESQEQERPSIPDVLISENMDATEREEIGKGKVSVGKKRKLRKKRDQSRCNYRSRSPIKKAKAETFHTLNRDLSDEVCYWVASNHFLPEPMEADMDIDLEKEVDVVANYDARRHRNAVNPPQTNASGVHANRKESSCSNLDNQKVAPCLEGNNEYFSKKNVQTQPSQMDDNANDQNNWFHSEEEGGERGNTNRSYSLENEMNASEGRQASLCSFCDKNEINT